MRELYAAELKGTDASDNATAWPLVDDWARRHLPDGQASSELGAPALAMEEASSGAQSLVLSHPDDNDVSLTWHAQVAVGPIGEPLHATVRVRLVAETGAVLRPLEYEFGSPTIVRTLLRECKVLDGGSVVSPSALELGQSDVDGLVDFLARNDRRLPVVLVTRDRATGDTLLDERKVAMQLAGLAHVRVLASNHASWRLTEVLGGPLSAWDGAIRVYFPGFDEHDEPRRHRLYHPDKVNDLLIARLRSWLGALAASRTPEHPIFQQLREDRRERLREAAESDDVEVLTQLVEEGDRENQALKTGIQELQERETTLQGEVEALTEELEAVRRQWATFSQSQATAEQPELGVGQEPTTVPEAVACIEELATTRWYAQRVSVSDGALRSARAFADYQRPAEMVRAVQAVLEAGALYHGNLLGEPPSDFFSRRGYGYGSHPGPHLKVDEATSPDQCLRIYWNDDAARRRWKITHIGRHK